MFSTMILVCLEGVGTVFICLTANDFSIVTLSPAGVSDWYWMAVVEVNEGLVSWLRIVVRDGVNDSHVNTHRTRHSAK